MNITTAVKGECEQHLVFLMSTWHPADAAWMKGERVEHNVPVRKLINFAAFQTDSVQLQLWKIKEKDKLEFWVKRVAQGI